MKTPETLRELLVAYAVATGSEEDDFLEENGDLADWLWSSEKNALEWASENGININLVELD
jgi:hypothetical protein